MTTAFSERYGPWAVIAGASEGTGAAFARKIAAEGVNCILIARREAPLTALAEELRARTGVECLTATIDLATPDATERLVDAVGGRDVGLFVSNAGADPNGVHFLNAEAGVWQDLVNRNVTTTMRCCHHLGGLMRSRGRGGIILVGSGACYGGLPSIAIYSATKAFELCFGEGLWAELRHHGVDVLNLILGRTDTPAFRLFLANKGLPVPADLASPDDVAEAGLANLANGPVHNFGQQEDEAGHAPNSAAARRARILMIEAASKELMGAK